MPAIDKISQGLKEAITYAEVYQLRTLAVQIEKYGTSNMDIRLTDEGERDVVEALRFKADILERAYNEIYRASPDAQKKE
jgi:hypothetical protein